MKYLNVKPIRVALETIHTGGNTQEHRTSRATSGLINHYFPKEKYIVTPEQIQDISNKRPDYTIEKLEANDKFTVHAYAEVKSLVNSNFDNILDQLSDTIVHVVDSIEGNSVFAIAMKGTKIAIFVYQNYASLLDDYGILNYNGFTPLNYEIPLKDLEVINDSGFNSIGDYAKHMKVGIETNPEKLRAMGVLSTAKMNHPHIWDLLNKDHENHIHNMFMRIANSDPGLDIK